MLRFCIWNDTTICKTSKRCIPKAIAAFSSGARPLNTTYNPLINPASSYWNAHDIVATSLISNSFVLFDPFCIKDQCFEWICCIEARVAASRLSGRGLFFWNDSSLEIWNVFWWLWTQVAEIHTRHFHSRFMSERSEPWVKMNYHQWKYYHPCLSLSLQPWTSLIENVHLPSRGHAG